MNRREKLNAIDNYIVYYGTGKEDILADYDLAIVEPSGQSENSINYLKDHDTIVIAYVSIIELPDYSPNFTLFKEEDYLWVEGKKMKNEQYGTFMMDMESKKWRAILNHNIGNLIYQQGYDGIFLDTIGDAENCELPLSTQNRMINSVARFVEELRSMFGDIIMIQNNGLERVLKSTAKEIDGVCWENPPFESSESFGWCMVQRNYLLDLFDLGKKILLLTEGSNNPRRTMLCENTAAIYHLLYYHAQNGFVKLTD